MAGSLETEPAEYVLLDLFPCTVQGPEGTIGPEVRVILTDNHLYAFQDAPTGPQIVLKAPHNGEEGYTGTITAGFQVGDYSITRLTSCGCGSRLRSFFPFIGVPIRALNK